MKDNVYSKLRRHLDKFILGAPENSSILEILRIRFTPEEAELALILGPGFKELSVLAQSSGREEGSLRLILEQMADKALVFKETKFVEGVSKEFYRLLPTMVGLIETSFAKGERSPITERLAHLWREYYRSGWNKHIHGGKTPLLRVIPVEKSIPFRQEIYSYERASAHIKENHYACVVHCACRKSAELDGKGCGKPTEVCLHFGKLAKFFVARGYAKEVNHEEALAILDTTEKAGLVHLVSNSKEMGVTMCSCCACCCVQLRAISEMAKPNAVAKSRFIVEVEIDECISCKTCNERCWVNAIALVDGIPKVDGERCIGCGLCVTACAGEALSLKERDYFQEPITKLLDLGKVFIQERKGSV